MRDRPVFLTLWKIYLPLAGFISITHRISGILFFLAFPLLIYIYSLLPLAFELTEFLEQFWVKFMLWAVVNLYLYHFLAGVRHMIADFGHDHSLARANLSAIMVLSLSIILAIWTGVLIW